MVICVGRLIAGISYDFLPGNFPTSLVVGRIILFAVIEVTGRPDPIPTVFVCRTLLDRGHDQT